MSPGPNSALVACKGHLSKNGDLQTQGLLRTLSQASSTTLNTSGSLSCAYFGSAHSFYHTTEIASSLDTKAEGNILTLAT